MNPPPSSLDPARFVAINTDLLAVPLVPEIRLHLAHEAIDLWSLTEAELGQIGLPPPFWAFAWAGGKALARHVLDHPEIVAGKNVLDFASGSGLVAIAAAKAGAKYVEAAEIDAFALAAITLNAARNGVAVTPIGRDLIGTDEAWDVVLVADIFYESDTAARITPWLEALAARGAQVLIGDPGRTYLPQAKLRAIASYDVPVSRALEDAEFKKGTVWVLAGA